MGRPSTLPDLPIDLVQAPPSIWTWDDIDYGDDEICTSVFCAICGLVIGWHCEFEKPWHHDVVLVGDPAREYEYVQKHCSYPLVVQEPAIYSATHHPEACLGSDECSSNRGCCFLVQDRVRAYAYAAVEEDRFNGGPDGKNMAYLPTHRACLQIALTAPVWNQAASTTSPLRAMFRVLRHRYQVTWEQRIRSFPDWLARSHLCRPHRFDTTVRFSGYQNAGGQERGCCSSDYIHWGTGGPPVDDDDPSYISALTETLLANLEPLPPYPPTERALSFRKHFVKLPDELKFLVFEYLLAERHWPLTCTRLLGSRFWKATFNKNLESMSWLWDLNHKIVHQTDPDLSQNWELLFRKISQRPTMAISPGASYESFRGVLSRVPSGLECRRRLWTLIEEMYVGDRTVRGSMESKFFDFDQIVAEGWTEVPVYWSRDGQPLKDDELRALG